MNAAQLLENSLQADANVREAATKQLEQAAQNDFHGYLHTLAAELANESSAPHIRRAAGLAFKNALAARDTANQGSLTDRYLALPDSATQPLKQSLLSTLGSPQHAAGSVAAQCISAVAAIELPAGKWPELIGLLLEFVQNQDNVGLRINTLQAVGYICEVIRPDILATRSNEILTAVVQGARKEEPSMEVQSAAIHSLYNSLEFIRDNFEREGERNYIMQVVCEATQSASPAVQVGAFECLVRIMGLYYSKMDFYMERALFGLTTMGMRHSEEPVVLQAIEFWSTVCEEEIDINHEAQEAAMYGETPAIESKGFAKMALPEILPTLLGLLSDQSEDDDEDDWTKSMAAASCLELLARNVGDAIVQPVVPFVEQGISQADWQHREAAVMAFGSIIDGPEPSTLAPLVTQAFGALISMMTSDPSPQVRDTVAWTLGRICEIMLETIDPSIHIENLVGALLSGLNTTPRIATSCCHALTQLVNQINMPHAGDVIPTSPLSPLYPSVFQALMPLSEKGTNESSSRTAAYNTISAFIASSAQDTLGLIQEVFLAMLSRQEALLGMQSQLVGSDDRQNWNDMQVNICVVIQSVILKSPEMVSAHSDRIMTNVLQIISSSGKQSGVLEDAFATVGTLARESKSGFDKYLEAFNPFLLQALNSYDDWQVCQAAVYVVSDIASAVGPQWTGQAEQIMVCLIEILRSPVIHRSVKPNAITAIGDLALAIGPAFVPYLQGTMDILSQAGSTTAPADDIAMLDFVWQMREAIVDTFTSILSGIKDQQPQAFKPYVSGIVGFLRNCWVDEERTDAFCASLINLLGDFGDTYRRDVRDELMQEWVQDAVAYGRSGKGSRSAKDGAAYLQSAIKELSK